MGGDVRGVDGLGSYLKSVNHIATLNAFLQQKNTQTHVNLCTNLLISKVAIGECRQSSTLLLLRHQVLRLLFYSYNCVFISENGSFVYYDCVFSESQNKIWSISPTPPPPKPLTVNTHTRWLRVRMVGHQFFYLMANEGWPTVKIKINSFADIGSKKRQHL